MAENKFTNLPDPDIEDPDDIAVTLELDDGTELEWDEIAKNDILLIRRDILPGEAQPEGAIADFNRVIWSMDKVNGTLEYIEVDFEIRVK